ncbi:MAG: hypothetical protein QXS54_05760 [Candidatus Methanomethylicaceae archaeon]
MRRIVFVIAFLFLPPSSLLPPGPPRQRLEIVGAGDMKAIRGAILDYLTSTSKGTLLWETPDQMLFVFSGDIDLHKLVRLIEQSHLTYVRQREAVKLFDADALASAQRIPQQYLHVVFRQLDSPSTSSSAISAAMWVIYPTLLCALFIIVVVIDLFLYSKCIALGAMTQAALYRDNGADRLPRARG